MKMKSPEYIHIKYNEIKQKGEIIISGNKYYRAIGFEPATGNIICKIE